MLKPRNFLKRYLGNPAVRRRAWHRFLNRKADEHGLHVYRSHLAWQLPGQFQDVVDEWGDVPGIPLDRCFFIWSAGRYLQARGVGGATADCGVRFGKSTHFLLRGLADPTRPHHLFDSFEGLSKPSALDHVTSEFAGQWSEGDLAVSEETARAHLQRFRNCLFHKGWIPDTFCAVPSEARFAFVHVDVDLYEPTRACYEFFYDRLSPGGMIVNDDYGLTSCPGATRAVDEFVASRGEALLEVPTSQAVLIKR
jgi:O-methyltransferase